jgi:hypothetical protein
MSAEVGNHERRNQCRVVSETVEDIKIFSKSIKGQRNMITTLENAMEDQRKKLASVTNLLVRQMMTTSNSGSSEEDNKSASKSVNRDDNNDSSESE